MDIVYQIGKKEENRRTQRTYNRRRNKEDEKETKNR